MRLIDAESLSSMRFTREMHDGEGRLYVPFDEVAEAIFKAPTVEPVKRAHWEWIGGYGYQYRCSKCYSCAERRTNYCPNCGAKMDEEGEGHETD